jgi:peptide/nickel transport system substrate-binding protein
VTATRTGFLLSAIVALAIGCTNPGAGTSRERAPGQPAEGAQPPRTAKRITAAIYGDPNSVISRMNTAQVSIPGASAIEQLAQAALSEITGTGTIQPLLAEAVPSIENGLWKLLPDGRMEITWRIREGARWHDGTLFSADDLVLTTVIDQDRDLPILRDVGYESVESVTAVDPRTVVVRWSKPYIDADTMFANGSSGSGFAVPLPKHLLAETYLRDKTAFQGLPYWSQEFVGTGPFKVREFVPGSHVTLIANEQYLTGRPKLDEIEVRFILDLNTIVTNLLAGSVELTLGRGFSIEQALEVRDQWQNGDVRVTPRSWIVIHPQFINPSPPVVADVRFRKALMHATDRQQLMDTLQGGLTGVAHVYLNPSEPEYKDVENSVVRYEYDQRRAAQMIQDLGYSKGTDGLYRDETGQRLAVEMRTYGVKVSDRATVVIADEWTRFGISTEPIIVPPQRIRDREYLATFPGFLMYRQPNTASGVGRLRGALAPTAENGFVGSNYARYVNAEFDSLIDRFLTTVPRPERIELLRQTVHHISDRLNLMGLFYDAEITMAHKRMQNVTAAETRLWNIHEWDVK